MDGQNYFKKSVTQFSKIVTKSPEISQSRIPPSKNDIIGTLSCLCQIAFGCATRCHLSVHSLAMSRSGPVDGSHGGGGGGRGVGGGRGGGGRRGGRGRGGGEGVGGGGGGGGTGGEDGDWGGGGGWG